MPINNRSLQHRLSSVDVRLLRVFRTVVDCGGFAASEFELNIGRSTISRHISDLESRIGMKVCYRGPGGFSLSNEGKQVLEATNSLLDALNRFESDIHDIHRKLRGTLRFAFFDLAAGNPCANIQQAITRFTQTAPDVDMDITTDPPNVIEAGVINGRFDLGIVPFHRQSENLTFQPLYTETMVLYCGRGHPLFAQRSDSVDPAQLSQYRYAGFGFHSPNMHAGQKHGFNLTAKVDNEEALKVLLLSGEYIGYLPDHVAVTFVGAGQLAAVAEANTSYQTQLGAIVRKRPHVGRKTEEFLQCLKRSHGVAE